VPFWNQSISFCHDAARLAEEERIISPTRRRAPSRRPENQHGRRNASTGAPDAAGVRPMVSEPNV